MSFKLPASQTGIDSSLSLFNLPATECGIEGYSYERYLPVTLPLDNSSPLQFSIGSSSMKYISLPDSYLYLKGTLYDADTNKPITADDKVAFVNYPLMSMFRSCDITLNNTNITQGVSNLLPYKCMLDVIMNKSVEEINSSLQTAMVHMDDATTADSNIPLTGGNEGKHIL